MLCIIAVAGFIFLACIAEKTNGKIQVFLIFLSVFSFLVSSVCLGAYLQSNNLINEHNEIEQTIMKKASYYCDYKIDNYKDAVLFLNHSSDVKHNRYLKRNIENNIQKYEKNSILINSNNFNDELVKENQNIEQSLIDIANVYFKYQFNDIYSAIDFLLNNTEINNEEYKHTIEDNITDYMKQKKTVFIAENYINSNFVSTVFFPFI